MHDLLDEPAGDFDWGPDRSHWFRSLPPRAGDSADAVSALWPSVAVVIGAVLVAVGAALIWGPEFLVGPIDDDNSSSITEADVRALEPTPVLVHVTGQVARPGVVSVPADGRVDDAVEAAGGWLSGADLTQINLAARVSDGMQLTVPAAPPTTDQTGIGTADDHTGPPLSHTAGSIDTAADPDDLATGIDTAADPDDLASGIAVSDATEFVSVLRPKVRVGDASVASIPTPPAIDDQLDVDEDPLLSDEFEAFLRSQTGEPSREEHAVFLDPDYAGN